ncbi:MAG: ATP-binding protein [Bacteroidales bacterium]|nr:ATP-binding protein [Bacteroidales bacterium]
MNQTIDNKPVLDRFPLGVQSFEKLRLNNATYIDKTEYVYTLTHSSATSYFLARPRRFGKSLMCNTLRAYFEGKKELFEGLKIYQWEKDWVKYPILYLDFVSGNYTNGSWTLITKINVELKKYEEDNKIVFDDSLIQDKIESQKETVESEIELEGKKLSFRLEYDLAAIYNKTGLRTVIIVDEYDNPLINSVDLPTDKAIYRGFFSVLKSSDRYIRFAFMTGVTKFAKTSVFSGANQPEDISCDATYSAICGITHKEMMDNFAEYIQAFADKKKISYDQMVDKLITWYDSYLFHEEGTKVFNPVSLFTALKKKDLQNYWYQTGTPTFLMQRLRSTNYDYRLLDNDVKYLKDRLINYKDDDWNMELIPLLYYSGYLTIKSFEEDCDIVEYTLGFPNNEVKISFLTNIIDYFYHSDVRNGFDYLDFSRDFRSGNIDSVLNRFKALFAALPYANDKDVTLIERDFQNVIFLVFSILGHFAISEPHFSKGRADSILINNNYVYIFEFKVDKDAQTALNQIDLKNYAGRFKMDGKKIFKIGVNFSSTEKNITEWIAVEE